ncbi:porin [Azospirillum griseum]|uniref:Porin n=1 Tax=Azospirillum griseum TaxID=2496639 RepID=A0A431V9Y0_9PROT|nr:porin [Azospirillum griseum]RTR12775.1 porin [Azospirillum griseum]
MRNLYFGVLKGLALSLVSLPISLSAASGASFEVKVGGDVFAEWAFVSQDKDAGLRSTEMSNRFRLLITSTAKADNGLEYGARLRLRAASNARTNDADRAFLFVQGGFGTVQAGITGAYGATTLLSYQAPMDYQLLTLTDEGVSYIRPQTVSGRTVSGTDAGNTLGFSTLSLRYPSANGTSTQINYFTPKFAGLQGIVTYTPRSDSSNTDVNRVKSTTVGTTGYQTLFTDIVELAAVYDGKWDDWFVKASAEYVFGDAAPSSANAAGFKDLQVWTVGGHIGYGAWSFGGAYLSHGQSGQSKAAGVRRESGGVWHLGAQYKAGPWVAGAGFQRGKDAGSLTASGARTLNLYDAGFFYQLAPGLQIGTQYNYFTAESDQSTAALDRDDKGHVVMVRSVLVF